MRSDADPEGTDRDRLIPHESNTKNISELNAKVFDSSLESAKCTLSVF